MQIVFTQSVQGTSLMWVEPNLNPDEFKPLDYRVYFFRYVFGVFVFVCGVEYGD
jgi:hypothetical protein